MSTVKTSENAAFVGNIERANKISTFDVVQKCTAKKPISLGTVDGVHLFQVEMVVGLDTAFPTKKGGVTSALVLVPLDGAKSLKGEWGSIEFNSGNPFIYKASRMFTVLDSNGDVAKKGRVSSSKQLEEMQRRLDAQKAEFEKQLKAQREESRRQMDAILAAINAKK